MIVGLYIERESFIHRLNAGVKITSLFFIGTALFFLPYWWVQLGVVCIVLLLCCLSQLGWQYLRQMGWMIPFFIVSTIVLNGYFNTWEYGWVMGLRLLALVILSMLVSYTTTLEAMTAFLVKIMQPIKYVGGNPALLGLAVSFSLRFIPIVAMVLSDIREAQQVRGQKVNIIKLASPLIIRLLRISSEIAESLDARGFDSRHWKAD